MSNLILYTTDDGQSQIQLRVDLDTVWLTQLEMAELTMTLQKHSTSITKDTPWS